MIWGRTRDPDLPQLILADSAIQRNLRKLPDVFYTEILGANSAATAVYELMRVPGQNITITDPLYNMLLAALVIAAVARKQLTLGNTRPDTQRTFLI